MVNLLPAAYETQFMIFFFILMRMTGAVFSMPVLSAQTVPRPIRAAIAFWLAVLFAAPYIGLSPGEGGEALASSMRVYNGVIDFGLAAVCEFLIGLVLGFIFQILIAAVELSGEIIGKQAGFSAASVLDPVTGQDSFLLSQIKVWIATVVFLVIGGPEMVVMAISKSFQVIGPGEGFSFAVFSEAGYRTFVFDDGRQYALMSMLYIIGLRIALPMIGGMLLVSLAEAFIARTAPQLNIMSVGFAIRLSMALFILGNLIVFIIAALKSHLQSYVRYSSAFLSWMTPQ